MSSIDNVEENKESSSSSSSSPSPSSSIKEQTKCATSANIHTNNTNNHHTDEVNINTIDELLEKEKQHNKTEQWTKLDKTIKIQKLHQYAEKYGKDNSMSQKDIKQLKTFFTECLTKNKLNKTKDVFYDKEKHDITSIPSLIFNNISRNYTLKNMDTKRVSTLKSLTPKKGI